MSFHMARGSARLVPAVADLCKTLNAGTCPRLALFRGAHVYLSLLDATATVIHADSDTRSRRENHRLLRAPATRYRMWLELRSAAGASDVPVPPRDVLAMWAADLLSPAPAYHDEAVTATRNPAVDDPLFYHASRLALQSPLLQPKVLSSGFGIGWLTERQLSKRDDGEFIKRMQDEHGRAAPNLEVAAESRKRARRREAVIARCRWGFDTLRIAAGCAGAGAVCVALCTSSEPSSVLWALPTAIVALKMKLFRGFYHEGADADAAPSIAAFQTDGCSIVEARTQRKEVGAWRARLEASKVAWQSCAGQPLPPRHQEGLAALMDSALAHARFQRRVRRHGRGVITQNYVRRAIERYFKFLELTVVHQDELLVPTLDIALIWHTHQLSHRDYRKDCTEFLGRPPVHQTADTEAALASAYATTQDLWRKRFYTEMETDEAKRKAPILHSVDKSYDNFDGGGTNFDGGAPPVPVLEIDSCRSAGQGGGGGGGGGPDGDGARVSFDDAPARRDDDDGYGFGEGEWQPVGPIPRDYDFEHAQGHQRGFGGGFGGGGSSGGFGGDGGGFGGGA